MVEITSAILVGSSKETTMADSRNSLKSAILRITELSDNEAANFHDSFVD